MTEARDMADTPDRREGHTPPIDWHAAFMAQGKRLTEQSDINAQQAEEIARLREEVDHQTKEVRRMRLGWDRSHDSVKAERAQRIAAERVKLDAESRAEAAESQVQALRQALEKERELVGLLIQACNEVGSNNSVDLVVHIVKGVADLMQAALALPGEAAQPAGSFGYCAICYHPLDRCSHCDAGEAAPTDEEWVPHAFTPDVNRAVDQDGPIWCAQCAYHRESGIHAVCGEAAQEK